MLLPQPVIIPVQGATARDWNVDSFWYTPWGASGVHKGIDIFAAQDTPVLATTHGVVVFTGVFGNGGRVVLMLGPRWRLHYFAHLESVSVSVGRVLALGAALGTVGDSGNALGKAPHLHYSVLSLVPYPWRIRAQPQGWKRAFYLDPGAVIGE
ncbi:MAG: M23 family metallopeptidase [Pseudomonadota bacterium]